jgi:hypothetical protein
VYPLVPTKDFDNRDKEDKNQSIELNFLHHPFDFLMVLSKYLKAMILSNKLSFIAMATNKDVS